MSTAPTAPRRSSAPRVGTARAPRGWSRGGLRPWRRSHGGGPGSGAVPGARGWQRLQALLQVHGPALFARLSAGALLAGVVLGVLARLHSPSALWLDEALSVGIAHRPVPGLLRALRADGSPPFYYLLLHGWIRVFGASDTAVRALSTVLSLAALPLALLAGRRLGGPATGRAALLLLATSPFAVRYATETRMYALVQLLSLLGLLALLRAAERPTTGRLLPVALLSGLLALTHYWALFLLAATAAVLLALGLRGSVPARRSLAAMAAGSVVMLPWLPTFWFQVRRTGTPWAPTPKLVDLWYTVTGWSGGGTGGAVVLSLLLTALAGLALVGRRSGRTIVLSDRVDRRALLLLAGCVGTLVLGLVVGMVVHAGYAPRYSSVALVPGLLLAALGLRALPGRVRTVVLVLVTISGLVGSLPQLTSTRRTQAGRTAAALSADLLPGDVVAYCPDQLGPAVSRLLPAGTAQVVYPTSGSPELVDWVDYAQRNRHASPQAFAAALSQRATGAVFLVSAVGYLTFGRQCEELATDLAVLRGPGRLLSGQSGNYDEQQAVTRFGAVTPG